MTCAARAERCGRRHLIGREWLGEGGSGREAREVGGDLTNGAYGPRADIDGHVLLDGDAQTFSFSHSHRAGKENITLVYAHNFELLTSVERVKTGLFFSSALSSVRCLITNSLCSSRIFIFKNISKDVFSSQCFPGENLSSVTGTVLKDDITFKMCIHLHFN